MPLTGLRNTYYAMRHGHSLANQDGIVVSDPVNGVPGYGLSATGREQVQIAVRQSAIIHRELLIASSDFRRASETAELVNAACGASHGVVYDERLRERYFGSLELGSDQAYSSVWAEDELDAEHVKMGVESASSVRERTVQLVMDLERQHTGQTLLLVSHGDAIQILSTAFQGVPASTHRDIPHVETAEMRRLN